MASYLITGVSRGLGFEFVNQLAQNPQSTVIGLVRNKEATEEKIKKELGERPNVHILKADLTNYESIKAHVPEVTKITGGKLDYIIANAAFQSQFSGFDSLSKLGKTPDKLTEDLLESFNSNVVGNIHLFNLFMPLILKGTAKKVITLSTGMADEALVAKFNVTNGAPYAISKAAMNLAVAKFSAEYSKDNVLFLSISPGFVDTGNYNDLTEEQAAGLQAMAGRFAEYAPDFKGAATPESSVKDVLKVIDSKSVANGDGGAFISHLGNKQWL